MGNHMFPNELFTDELYSGYMPIKLGDCDVNQEGSFFFWLAKQRNLESSPPPKESLVIWLNGGPGERLYYSRLYTEKIVPLKPYSDVGSVYSDI